MEKWQLDQRLVEPADAGDVIHELRDIKLRDEGEPDQRHRKRGHSPKTPGHSFSHQANQHVARRSGPHPQEIEPLQLRPFVFWVLICQNARD